MINTITKAEAQLVVAYPEMGKTAYRPPEAMHIQVGRDGINHKAIQLKPLQGVIFDIKAPSRIVISLAKPDDGPGGGPQTGPRGWTKTPPVVEQARKTMPRPVNLPPDEGPTPKTE